MQQTKDLGTSRTATCATASAKAGAQAVERPSIVADEYLEFLDEMSESGEINMFGARPYLIDQFGLTKPDAVAILSYWMKSFSERHP